MSHTTTDPAAAGAIADDTLPEGPVERICSLIGELCLVALIVLIIMEIITRTFLGFSFEIVDEVGGYLLVALTFISLPTCLAAGAFHRVELVMGHLSPHSRILVRLVFTGVIFLFVLVLDYYLGRVVVQSYEQEAVAMTRLATPFWIPQLFMPLGITALAFTLLRRIVRDARLLRRSRSM
jgi:TRAP-type C4-dicarboxylate transport system permease small subunit